MKKKISILTLVWLIGLIVVTLFLLMSLFNSVYPFFDSLSDIRIWLAGFLILAALPLLITQVRRAALMLILFAVLIIGMSSQNGGVRPSPQQSSVQAYTLLQTNLRFDNKNHEKLIALIKAENPDFITYQEGSRQWQQTLKEIEASYPYRVDCPRSYGIIGSTGLMSRFPFTHRAPSRCPADGAAAIGTFHVNGHDVTVISIHLHWPWPYRQHEQLDMLRKKLELPATTTRLVAGDFNAVTWSYTVKRVETLTQTRHIATIGPTWLTPKVPVALRPYLGLPIDQVLISSDINVFSATRTTSIGSDHLPVKIQFTLP